MPEGPELRLVATMIKGLGDHYNFGGPVELSTRSKQKMLPFIPFEVDEYNLSAKSRGKELKVTLKDKKDSKNKTTIKFHFGHGGYFKFVDTNRMPKFTKLMFNTTNGKSALVFCDEQGAGGWEAGGDYGADRGPDAMDDPEEFRANILNDLDKPTFKHPICEVMLNQKYFNGIGNYLRAEIMYRAFVEPFEEARTVLSELPLTHEMDYTKPDLIDLCTFIQREIINLGAGKTVDHEPDPEHEEKFRHWLRCYAKDGMSKVRDANGRMVWFEGEPGRLLPKSARVTTYNETDEGHKSDHEQKDGTEEDEPKRGSRRNSKMIGSGGNSKSGSGRNSKGQMVAKCCPMCPIDGFTE